MGSRSGVRAVNEDGLAIVDDLGVSIGRFPKRSWSRWRTHRLARQARDRCCSHPRGCREERGIRRREVALEAWPTERSPSSPRLRCLTSCRVRRIRQTASATAMTAIIVRTMGCRGNVLQIAKPLYHSANDRAESDGQPCPDVFEQKVRLTTAEGLPGVAERLGLYW